MNTNGLFCYAFGEGWSRMQEGAGAHWEEFCSNDFAIFRYSLWHTAVTYVSNNYDTNIKAQFWIYLLNMYLSSVIRGCITTIMSVAINGFYSFCGANTSDLCCPQIWTTGMPAGMLQIGCILCILVTPAILAADDFYQLLGVDKSASTKEIRKAFKKLAISAHPDKNTVNSFFVCYSVYHVLSM